MERHHAIGFGYIGPLTHQQAASWSSWERYQAECQAEYKARMEAGGKSVCPECKQRTVKHRDVCTIGYPGHPGAEWSDFSECTSCGWRDLA